MTLCIDADCALAYWMSAGAKAGSRKRPSSETLLERIESGNLPDWAYAPDGTVHVVATSREERFRRRGMKTSFARATLPEGSFTVTDTGIPIVSPECTFLRLAANLELPELVKAGMMLCSGFCFDDAGCMIERREPPASAKSICDYVEKVAHAEGIKKARRAAKLIVDSAASPAEINVFLLLCLPRRFGGLGCPFPEMNGHVELRSDIARTLGYTDCYCDLLWRKERCAVEYTSELHHTGYQKQTRDEMRRAALEAMGYRVYLLMKNQLNSLVAFEGFARPLFRVFGKRFPKVSLEHQAQQHELRKHLLYESSAIISRACWQNLGD